VTTPLDNLLERWARVGAGFDVRPAPKTPDLELLLLGTARLAAQDARLVEVVVTWLCAYYELVSPHRLARQVEDQLEPQSKPVLGLLLDWVRQKRKTGHFNKVIALCAPDPEEKPLYEFQRRNPLLHQIARKKASAVSKRWGLWVEDFQLKDDAIRPVAWILRRNPEFALRERFEGDLRAAIVETLRRDPAAGCSESALARYCRASRDALRKALDRLIRYGYVEKVRHGKVSEVRLVA
jgi:hypothetical protein